MSIFTGDLTVTHMTSIDWRVWRIERELIYEVGSLGSGRVIAVPGGFMSDGASVPRLLWGLFPSWGSYSRAAVVHDYLCWRLNYKDPHPEAATRQLADAVFFEAMRVGGTGLVLTYVLWVGARLGGMMSRWFPRFAQNIVDRVNVRD